MNMFFIICIYFCLFAYVFYIYLFVLVLNMYIYMYIYIYTYIYIYMCVYIYIIYIYIYIYLQSVIDIILYIYIYIYMYFQYFNLMNRKLKLVGILNFIFTVLNSSIICFVFKTSFFVTCRVLPFVLTLLYRKYSAIKFELT